jgi:hypothetical protein
LVTGVTPSGIAVLGSAATRRMSVAPAMSILKISLMRGFSSLGRREQAWP